MPILKLTQPKRTSEELEKIAQDLFDIYHDDDEHNQSNKWNNLHNLTFFLLLIKKTDFYF